MATTTVSRAPSGATATRWDVDDMLKELRDRRFDLEHCLYVVYMVGTGQRRDIAFALRQRAVADGWRTSLYADAAGFVVRFGRSERVTRDLLVSEQRYLDSLAETYGATIRAVSVEDLDAAGTWARLAAQQSGWPMPRLAVDAPAGNDGRPVEIRRFAQASIAGRGGFGADDARDH